MERENSCALDCPPNTNYCAASTCCPPPSKVSPRRPSCFSLISVQVGLRLSAGIRTFSDDQFLTGHFLTTKFWQTNFWRDNFWQGHFLTGTFSDRDNFWQTIFWQTIFWQRHFLTETISDRPFSDRQNFLSKYFYNFDLKSKIYDIHSKNINKLNFRQPVPSSESKNVNKVFDILILWKVEKVSLNTCKDAKLFKYNLYG